jgi:hypothetical protein
MTMHDDNRSNLMPHERQVAGDPGDLVSEDLVPARPRSTTVMVSLRLDRGVFDGLNRLAERNDRTFSETARDALRTYVFGPAGAGYPSRDVHSASTGRKVSENRQLLWTDDDLRAALDRYEAASRGAGMREKAWRSYVDYARRFVAWRTGNYWPRGIPVGDRPVSRTAASIADLVAQAKLYAQQVQAAGREQSTVDTYYRHAMFFVRWLNGDFEPGRRLGGLR